MQFPLHSAFVALPLEGQAGKQFLALQESLRPFEECLRYQDPRTPHLTLQFWKEVMQIEYAPIVRSMERITSTTEPFTLRVTQAETFGNRGVDTVLFLNIAFSEELARLKKSCPWPNIQEFHPHITLARVRHAGRFAIHKKNILKALKDCSFDVPVDRLRLYAEIDGQKQTPLTEFPFVPV